MKKKILTVILSVLLILVSLAIGRLWGHSEAKKVSKIHDAISEVISEDFKEEFQKLTKDDFRMLMEQMRGFSKNAVTELSLKGLFETMTIMRIESLLKERGVEAIEEYATNAKKRFLSGYRDGSSNYGDWKPVADSVAKKLSENEK